MKIFSLFLLTVFAAVSPRSVSAQVPSPLPTTLTLSAANDRFLERNLNIEAARLRVSGAEAARVAARFRPRPSMTISAENLKIGGPTQFDRLYEAGAVFTQPVELGGQRTARRELADRSVTVAEVQLTSVIRQKQLQMRVAFFEVLLAQALVDLEADNQTNFGELVRYNNVRLEEGEISPGEMIKVRLEKIKYDSNIASSKLALTQAKIRLLEVLGETEFSMVDQLSVREPFDFRDYPIDPAQLREKALENQPELKIAEAEVARAEASLRLERARGSGTIEPYAGYKRVGPDNTAVAGVTIPLPIGNRNQGEIARAEAELKIAQSLSQQAKNKALADVQSAISAFETAREQIRAYEAGVLRQADESRDITLLSYREGAVDLVILLDSQRTRNEVRSAYYKSLQSFYTALFQLEMISGMEIRK